MVRTRTAQAVACLLLFGLGACAEKIAEPGEPMRRYADGVSPEDSARYAPRLSPSFSVGTAPSGTPQCRTPYYNYTNPPPSTYKVPLAENNYTTCTTTIQAVPHLYQQYGYYTGEITVTFSQPVYGIRIETDGAMSCSGSDNGHVTVYNAAGVEVEVGEFVLLYPDDCGADDVTGSRVDTVDYAGGIKSLTFSIPAPLTWYLPPPYVDAMGMLTQYYDIYFHEPLCPPTGDSILDSQAMRDLLSISWDSSNASDPVKTNRRERGGVLFQNPTTGQLTYVTDFDPEDTPCKGHISPDSFPGTPVAQVHTHPFTHMEPTTGVCSPAVPGVPRYYDAKTFLGPSDEDIIGAQASGYNIPYYVMDKDNIYVIPPGTTLQNFNTKIQKYPRSGPNGCVRP